MHVSKVAAAPCCSVGAANSSVTTALLLLQVFEHVGRPAIEPVVQGISGTVFAYGVTSSGKTHTMMGTPADPGVVPRAIAALFDQIGQATDRCVLQDHAQELQQRPGCC
jgi:hypothetical protein